MSVRSSSAVALAVGMEPSTCLRLYANRTLFSGVSVASLQTLLRQGAY